MPLVASTSFIDHFSVLYIVVVLLRVSRGHSFREPSMSQRLGYPSYTFTLYLGLNACPTTIIGISIIVLLFYLACITLVFYLSKFKLFLAVTSSPRCLCGYLRQKCPEP